MRLTWLGGSGILDRIEAVDYDVFRRRPHYGLLDKLGLAWRARRWRS
jgi:phytoene synthase